MQVYTIRHRESGKLYVGLTRGTVGHRWGQHKSNARKGIFGPLYNAMRKYGPEAFDVACIADCPSPGRAQLTERALIEALEPAYNVQPGGQGGYALPASTRAKIGAKSKGRPLSAESREKIAASKRGKPLSAETRAKMSAAHQNRPPPTAETRAKLSASQRGNQKMRGKTRSPETRAKISAAMKGNRNRSSA